MERFEEFCCRLASAIKASGMSRAQLAEQLGVKPATIKSWCVGRRSPTIQRFVQLTQILDVEPGDLFAPLEGLVRKECSVCGRTFRREVGYRIHLALRSREDTGHRALSTRVPA